MHFEICECQRRGRGHLLRLTRGRVPGAETTQHCKLRHYGLEVFDESRMKVTLIEAGPRILPALPEKLSEAAHAELENLGVRILTGTAITEVTAQGMLTKSGDFIPADLSVWAAGVD